MASIRSRHHFLQKLTGKTKPEEESSYEIANKLALALPLCSLALCVLEAVLYFVYNRQVIRDDVNMSYFQHVHVSVPYMVQNTPRGKGRQRKS